MNSILNVTDLCKSYPNFKLDHVSFSLEKGKITGFIGRNGAGKSTTLNSLLNFIHSDSGDISFFGKRFYDNELEIKQKIGFVSSSVNFYNHKQIKKITKTVKTFYTEWDDTAYKRYLQKFFIDEDKKISQLSTGMKIKYFLTLALSHNAELLILDEPTSGLDPVSREEILEIFLELCDKGKTILFSTHIISDLEKCADNIVYIRNGRIIAESDLHSFVNQYKIAVSDSVTELNQADEMIIGKRRNKNGFTALIKKEDASKLNLLVKDADLDSVIIHMEGAYMDD